MLSSFWIGIYDILSMSDFSSSLATKRFTSFSIFDARYKLASLMSIEAVTEPDMDVQSLFSAISSSRFAANEARASCGSGLICFNSALIFCLSSRISSFEYLHRFLPASTCVCSWRYLAFDFIRFMSTSLTVLRSRSMSYFNSSIRSFFILSWFERPLSSFDFLVLISRISAPRVTYSAFASFTWACRCPIIALTYLRWLLVTSN